MLWIVTRFCFVVCRSILRYILLSSFLILCIGNDDFGNLSLKNPTISNDVLSIDAKYSDQNFGNVAIDLQKRAISVPKMFFRGYLFKDSPVFIYETPHFYIKVKPKTHFSGSVSFRSDNVVFGKIKFDYFIKDQKLYLNKVSHLDVFFKPVGLKIGKDEKLQIIFDVLKMRGEFDEDKVKGFFYFDKDHQLIGEADLLSEEAHGKVHFCIGKVFRAKFKLNKVVISSLIERCIFDYYKTVNTKKSKKGSSFDVLAEIDRCILDNGELKSLKCHVSCIDSRLKSFLFCSKIGNGISYASMDSKNQVHIKLDSVSDLINLIKEQKQVKNGEAHLLVKLLSNDLHDLKFLLSGDIRNIEIDLMSFLGFKNIFAPIRGLRMLFKPSSEVNNIQISGIFDSSRFSLEEVEIKTDYNRILINGHIDGSSQTLDLMVKIYYQNFLTYAARRFSIDSLSDLIKVKVSGALSAPAIEVAQITPGAFLGFVLQPIIV